jgi:hypothetical protein
MLLINNKGKLILEVLIALVEMVIALKHRNNTYKLIIILVLTISGLFILTKDSFASNPTFVGFIIEASQMEGIMQDPAMITGDTSEQKDRPMLELKFQNLSADGLTIKKLVNTPKGIVTIDMTPKDTVLFNNISLNITNAVFSGNYLPINGNIGLKNVKLLAHRVTTDSSSLPQFNLSFDEGGQTEMDPKSEIELIHMKAVLEQLLQINKQ